MRTGDKAERVAGSLGRRRTLTALTVGAGVLAFVVLYPWRGFDPGYEAETYPFDPSCSAPGRCEAIALLGRRGPYEARLMYDRKADGPVRQWARCVDEIGSCASAGRDLPACVAESRNCTEGCRELFAERVAGRSPGAAVDVVTAMFATPDGECVPRIGD